MDCIYLFAVCDSEKDNNVTTKGYSCTVWWVRFGSCWLVLDWGRSCFQLLV